MTEYDFSPEAYERHLEKQHNIARWVDKTRRYVPANPFFPATPANRHAALEDTRYNNSQPNRHHRSHSSHSSKHNSRRHRSTEPSSAHRRSASCTAPPAQWQPVVDRHTDPYYARVPQHAAPVYQQQQYPVAPRPLRVNTTPAYLYPAPSKNNPYTIYPNPIAPHASTRRVGSGKSGHSVSGFGQRTVGRD